MVKKSGLADALGLEGDLQKTPEMAEPCALLTGALDYLNDYLKTLGHEEKQSLKRRGVSLLREEPERKAKAKEKS
jgi:hypothetical protein